jgi:TPR repeat protein
MYENGYAVAQDYGQAVSIYGKACRDGDGLGCNNLGLMYQAGRGTAQDFGQALSLYSKACDAGNAIGCNNLGILYENGRGAAPDFGQAVSQYRKACDGGNDFGCSNLGRMYENGRGVARDLVQGRSAEGLPLPGKQSGKGSRAAEELDRRIELLADGLPPGRHQFLRRCAAARCGAVGHAIWGR